MRFRPIFFQTRYTLHAVCVHEGTVNLGHFWTYVYHLEREKWYRYNDNEGTWFLERIQPI